MDVSRLKKVLSGVSVTAIALTQMGLGTITAFAKYSDVPAGVWYEDAVQSFMDAGYLDASQTKFRGGDKANRAEFVKLIVELNGGVLSTPPAVPSFTDVASGAWYYSYMEEAAKEGWVRGDGDCYGSKPCYARPGANIVRAEAAALIVRAFSLDASGDAPQFVDNPSGQWYTDSIQAAADHCVLQGDDSTGRVRPADPMNRAEMVVMLNRVDQNLQYGVDCTTAGPVSAPGVDSAEATSLKTIVVDFTVNLDKATAETLANYKVTAGSSDIKVTSAKLTGDNTVELTVDGSLDPSTTYTVTVSGMMSEDGKTFSDSASFKGYSTIPQGNGSLEVSVSSKNPVGDTVPKGANGVTMLALDLSASCADSVTVEDLTILHEGFGATTDIDGVYAAVDGGRVTRKRTIDSKDQAATLHFTKPLTIAACKSVTLDVLVDFTTNASVSGEHAIVVELPSDVLSNAKQVTGSFPMRGKTFRIGAVTSGTVSIAYRSVNPNQVNVGDKAVELGRFEISTNSVEDQTIYSITLQQNGTAADGDVANMKVRRSDGTVLTNTVDSAEGDYSTFVFNPPFIVKQGDKVTLSVVGDIMGGAGETVIMQVEESSDIFAVGSLYGYGVNGQLYGSRVSVPASNSNSVTIGAGEFHISIDGPAQQTYTADQDDAVVANVKFNNAKGDKVDVRKMYIALSVLTSTGAGLAISGQSADTVQEVLENVTLKNSSTGRSVDAVRLTGSSDATCTAAKCYQIYRFDDFTVASAETWELMVDFIDNGAGTHPRNGDQITAYICGEPTNDGTGSNSSGCFGDSVLLGSASTAYQLQVEGVSTGDDVTDVRPRGTITGNAQRIATTNLTVGIQNSVANLTAVRNSKNVSLMRFEARAGEAKDVLFTKATFASASGSLNNGVNYSLWVDTDNNGTVDTVLESGVSAQSSKVTFSNLTGGGFVIPKEKTVVFEVHADIAGALTATSGSSRYWLKLAFDTGQSYIEAEDVVRGSSLSGINTDGGGCSATTCDIIVTTSGRTVTAYLLVSQGDLYVTKDTVSISPRQCLGGELCDTVLRLQFHSENEPIDVTDLQISSSGSTTTSVDRLELYKEGSTTAFAVATTSGCGSDETFSTSGNNGAGTTSTFCAKMQSKQLVIPKGQDLKVLVKPRLKTDLDGAISNQTLQFQIDATRASNNATGSGAVRARGADSSNNLSANNNNSVNEGEIVIGTTTIGGSNAWIRGERHVSVLSKIASITNANPAANGTAVPVGASDLGMFKVTAANNNNSNNGLNKVVLSGVIFNVSATNVALDATAFVFYNAANSTVTSACTSMSTAGVANTNVESGSFLVLCKMLQSSNVNVTTDPGASSTFVLKGTVTNPKVANTNSTLQVTIQNFNSSSNVTFGPTTSHFQWQDKDNNATATFNWVEYGSTSVNSTTYQS